jgi:hypothetical protein
LVARTGIEPVVSALRGRRVKPITLPGHNGQSIVKRTFQQSSLPRNGLVLTNLNWSISHIISGLDVVSLEDCFRRVSCDLERASLYGRAFEPNRMASNAISLLLCIRSFD